LVSKRNNNDARIVNQYTNYTKGTAPSSTQHSGIRINDSEGTEIADVNCAISTENTATLQLLVKDPGTGTSTAKIAVIYPANGTAYTQAPNPPSGDNSTKIATTSWVNTKVTSAIVPNYNSPTTASTTYTPTANGTLHASVTGGRAWAQIACGSHVLARSETTDSTTGTQVVWVIVKKGQTYTVTGSARPTVTFYPFS
jgi:hypothetical protein